MLENLQEDPYSRVPRTLRVTIEKNLVQSAAELKAYVDGSQTEYSVTSTEDFWILAFDYPYSIHQVIVGLGNSAVRELSPLSMLLLLLSMAMMAIAHRRRHMT